LHGLDHRGHERRCIVVVVHLLNVRAAHLADADIQLGTERHPCRHPHEAAADSLDDRAAGRGTIAVVDDDQLPMQIRLERVALEGDGEQRRPVARRQDN
jgi:hypothetical protein